MVGKLKLLHVNSPLVAEESEVKCVIKQYCHGLTVVQIAH